MARSAAATQWPKGQPFEHLPTFEDLQLRFGIKVAALRAKLLTVPRFRCADNTVRYEPEAADKALEGVEPVEQETDDPAAAAMAAPLSSDPTQAALQVVNRTLALLGTVVRERGEIVKLCNDTIKTMGEPLKLGQELVREAQQVMRERLKHYDETWLDMHVLVEELHSAKDTRERAAQQQVERSNFRRETFALAKEHLPDALSKFSLTVEAQLALDLLRGLDPDMLGPIVEAAVPDELQPKARKLVDILKQRRRAPAATPATVDTKGETPKEEGKQNGSSQATTETAPP
jgi:hypothetical protein